MLSIILTLACNDHYMAYPIDKVQDTEEETIEDPVDTIGIYDEPMDTGDYGDTGYEEPINETDEPVEETDEPVDTGYEEPVEETDEPVEVEEDTDTGSTTTVPTDNYNYSDDWTISSRTSFSGAPYYADDYGWTMIDSGGGNGATVICGIQNSGLIDCSCINHNTVSNQCNGVDIVNHIPFQQVVDVSVGAGQVCAIDLNGSAFCWDNNGVFFNLPQFNPYVDIVSMGGGEVCGLDSVGSMYCFDTGTGGVVFSDTNTYKVIEGKNGRACGVLSSGVGIECAYFGVATSYTVNGEIIGMDVGSGGMCYAYIDANQMQNIECVPYFNTHSNSYSSEVSCLGSSPHEYYYDFFSNSTDLSNVEVGGIGGFYDPSQNLTVLWGGRLTIHMGNVVNSPVDNGYYTGSGCNYYWGN